MLAPKTPTSIVSSRDLPLVLFYGVLSAIAESGVGNESRWAAPKARTADGYLWEHHALQINRRPGSELCGTPSTRGIYLVERTAGMRVDSQIVSSTLLADFMIK
jgi:hypothetical protein